MHDQNPAHVVLHDPPQAKRSPNRPAHADRAWTRGIPTSHVWGRCPQPDICQPIRTRDVRAGGKVHDAQAGRPPITPAAPGGTEQYQAPGANAPADTDLDREVLS